jgi:dihydrolipoamide dehydrogenase
MVNDNYDVAVVGAGPGGYVAAIRAAQLGLKTALVERADLGGVCLNWGCIPTKALLRSADVLRLVQRAGEFGVTVQAPHADLPAMVKRSRSVAAQLQRGVAHLMKKNGVTVIRGSASLAGGTSLRVQHEDSETLLRADHVILATGARARALPGLTPDGKTVWTYRDALVPVSLPSRLLVVGAGAIGVEFACFYKALGVQVTLIDMADRVLPAEDEEISAHMLMALRKQGITVVLGTRLAQTRHDGSGWTVSLEQHADPVHADVLLLAAGIEANIQGLGLEATGIKTERGHIVTDAYGATDEPGIYAIGDVAQGPWLAHKASHEAVVCVEKIAGHDPSPLNLDRVPACTYGFPQVAHIGLTERQATDRGHAVRTGRFPFSANGKAIAMGATEGFVKVVMDATSGELLGAHMIGEEVTEMIQGYGLAMELETTEAEMLHTMFAHPTQSEAMHEAVLAAYERAVHI